LLDGKATDVQRAFQRAYRDGLAIGPLEWHRDISWTTRHDVESASVRKRCVMVCIHVVGAVRHISEERNPVLSRCGTLSGAQASCNFDLKTLDRSPMILDLHAEIRTDPNVTPHNRTTAANWG